MYISRERERERERGKMVSEGISMQYTTIIQVVGCLNSQDNCQKQFFYGHNVCHIMLK